MDPEQTNIKLDVSKWNVRVDERKRNRMKLQIKLSKDEAQGYRNFADICKPVEITDADFMKTVFLTGIEAMNQQLADLVKKYASENKEELAASGITVLEGEDGEIKLADTSVLEHDMSGAPPIQEGDLNDQVITKYTEKK